MEHNRAILYQRNVTLMKPKLYLYVIKMYNYQYHRLQISFKRIIHRSFDIFSEIEKEKKKEKYSIRER